MNNLESIKERAIKIKNSCQFKWEREFGQTGKGDWQFNNVQALVINPKGNLLVLDAKNYRICQIDLETDSFSVFWSDPEEQYYAVDMICLSDETIALCCHFRKSILIINSHGQIEKEINISNYCNCFTGLAEHKDHLFASDMILGKISVFNRQGDIITDFGKDILTCPARIKFFDNNLLVSEPKANRVTKIKLSDNFEIRNYNYVSDVKYPIGTYLSENNLYICDYEKRSLIKKVGEKNIFQITTAFGKNIHPISICYYNKNRQLFISDSLYNRILTANLQTGI